MPPLDTPTEVRTTANPTPLSSAPAFDPERDGILERYSARHELPLSLASSVGIHVVVVLLVVALGLYFIPGRPPAPPKPGPLIEIGVQGDGGTGGSGNEGGDPNSLEFQMKTMDFTPGETSPEAPKNLGELPLDNDKPIVPPLPNTGKDKLATPGQPGPGTGGGPGLGGRGWPGSGTPERLSRMERWIILMPSDDARSFLAKLQELQAILVLPESPGTFLLFEDLTQTRPSRSTTILELRRLNRIWYTSRDYDLRRGLAAELGLTQAPDYVAMFIPQSLESELLKQELLFRGLNETQLMEQKWQTSFEVTRRGNDWIVKVREQKQSR